MCTELKTEAAPRGRYQICLEDHNKPSSLSPITNLNNLTINIKIILAKFHHSIYQNAGAASNFLAKLENTLTVMIYHSFFSTIVFLVFFLNKIEFNLYHNFLSIILLTITALACQYFNSESYRYGKTNSVIIIGYSRIVFSTLLGFFFSGRKN